MVAKLPNPTEEEACLVGKKVFENPDVVLCCPSCCKANLSYSDLKAVVLQSKAVLEGLQRQIQMLTEAVTWAFTLLRGQPSALTWAQSTLQCSQEVGQHITVLMSEPGEVTPSTSNCCNSTFDSNSFMLQMRKMVYQPI